MGNELKRVALDGKAPKHKVGDEVTWKAREYDPESHTGHIVAILEPGEYASPHVQKCENEVSREYQKSRDRTGGGSTTWRYLVNVPRARKARALAPLWYSPRVSVVDREVK